MLCTGDGNAMCGHGFNCWLYFLVIAQDWKEGQCECYCEECSSMVHINDLGISTGHEILPTVSVYVCLSYDVLGWRVRVQEYA